MDNNENKNQETELEEVKTEEAVETAEKAVDNADDVEEAQIEKEPVLSFEYDVKNEEEERAFLAFQKKFVYAHNWKITAAFGVVAVLFIVSIVRNPSGYLNWVLAFICLAIIVLTWYNTRRIRKYLMQALKPLEDDKYVFTLYDDSFNISVNNVIIAHFIHSFLTFRFTLKRTYPVLIYYLSFHNRYQAALKKFFSGFPAAARS